MHLHWDLPQALTQASHDQQNDKHIFPDVPDRWLVTRVAICSDFKEKKVNAWVIESNYLNESNSAPIPRNVDSMAIPYPLGTQNYSYLGGVYPVSDWREQQKGNYFPHLTTIGFGIPDFAAYYPNCRNVFGFHDDLSNLDPNKEYYVSYVVTGWHGPQSDDPLSQKDWPTFWENADWMVKGDPFPMQSACCLYSGFIQSLIWNPTSTTTTVPKRIDAVLAPNSREAFAHFVASQQQKNPNLDLETLLNVFQLGLMDQYKTGVLTTEGSESVHQARFASHQGGKIWNLKANDNKQIPDSKLASELNAFNLIEQQKEKLKNVLQEQKFQIFADWYHYLKEKYSGDSKNDEPKEAFIKWQISNVLTPNQDTLKQLNKTPPPLVDPKFWELKSTAGPRYWSPRDPVLLLSGDDIAIPSDYKLDKGMLLCRFPNQLLTQVTVPQMQGLSKEFSIQDFSFRIPYLVPHSKIMMALLNEAAFLDPYQIAYYAIQNGLVTNQNDFVNTLSTSLSRYPDDVLLTWVGNLPSSVAFASKETPWAPFLFQWEASYQPVTNLENNLQFDDKGIDYAYPSMPLVSEQAQIFKGSLFLTPLAQSKVHDQLDYYLKKYPKPADPNEAAQYEALQDVKKELNKNQTLVQTLHGLTNAFLMRDQTIQLPVGDPFTDDPSFVHAVKEAVDKNNLLAPTKDDFNPIKGGALQITKIRLINVFGDYKDYDPSTTTLNVTVCSSYGNSKQNIALLKPRLTQPSRLLFNFHSAADDKLEQTVPPLPANPIYGWILPDLMENTLALYNNDSETTFLGNLLLDEGSLKYQPPLTNKDLTIQAIIKLNPHFGNIIQAIQAIQKQHSFFQTITQSLNAIIPSFSQDPDFSRLLAWPLALVRTSLQLEIKGGPAFDQNEFPTTESSYKDADGVAYVDRQNGQFSSQAFPMQVGNVPNLNLRARRLGLRGRLGLRRFWTGVGRFC